MLYIQKDIYMYVPGMKRFYLLIATNGYNFRHLKSPTWKGKDIKVTLRENLLCGLLLKF